jgi:hypothetical protein
MSDDKRTSDERRQHEERRLAQVIERRASERAAELAMLPACMTKEEEEAEEAYIDRMHRAQNDAWRARGWTPFVEVD